MNEGILLERLDILENKIMSLLELVGTLRRQIEELTVKYNEKEEEVHGLKQEMEYLLGEKELVKQKVAHLITCVEAF
jgi:FtsZ-binding cell division protein ZapB